MIRLNSESVRQFSQRTSSIDRNTLLPILNNLKLEIKDGLATLTKNNLSAVCIGQVQYEGEPAVLLLDERILLQIANMTKSEWIEIHQKEGKILLKEQEETYLPLEDPILFPPNPDYSEEGDILKLLPNHIQAIRVAKEYTYNNEKAGSYQFVHLEGENIFAFYMNYFFYINNSFKNLPSLSLRQDEVNMVCGHETMEFLNLPNHHVFFTPGYTYIYTKPEAQIPKLDTVFQRLQLPGTECTFNRDELADFIQRANIISESPTTLCSLTANGGMFIKLSMSDAAYSRSNDRVIACTGIPDEFTFNSRIIQKAVPAIPYPILNAKTNQNCLIIQQGAEWFCFVGMSKEIKN